jgi:hypothetical protein
MPMRRLSGVVLAGAILILPAFSQSAFAQEAQQQQQPQQQQQQPAPQKTTFTGDAVLWAFEVLPGKEADYEQVIAKLKDALSKSTRPEAKQQLAGWKVIKNATPQPNGGGFVYVHVIHPVVKDADYSITNIVYETSTDEEKRAFYDLYRGALKQALFIIQGPLAADLSQ